MTDLPVKKYCTCGNKAKFVDFYKVPKPSWFPKCEATHVYVCVACNRVSHAVEELAVPLRGPKDAILLSVAGQVAYGVSTLRWRMPDSSVAETVEFKPYPRNDRMHETQTEPLLFALWRQLDERVDQIMAEPQNEYAKNTARGMAECIALLMTKFYSNADAVVKEAVKRQKARAAGEERESPGLGEHLFNAYYNADGSERTQVGAKASQTAKKKASPFAKKVTMKPKGSIPESALAGIKMALDSGMFTHEQICKTYDVSPEQLKEVTG